MSIDQEALQELSFAANDPRNRYWYVYKLIEDKMAWACDPFEYRVLMFIFARTWKYGKDSESIPEQHFLGGVYHMDSGQELHAPVNISKAKLYKTIASLLDKHMIVRLPSSKRGNVPTYMINTHWGFANVSKGNAMGGSINMSKKRRVESLIETRQSPTKTRQSSTKTRESLIETPINTDTNIDIETSVAEPRDVPLREKLNHIASASSAARQRRIAKGGPEAIAKVWIDTWRGHYPDDPCPAPLRGETAALHRALGRVTEASDRIPFLIWSIENFRSVMVQKYKYMTKGGAMDLPKMLTLTKYVTDFHSSYLDAVSPNRKLDRRIRESETEADNPDKKRIAELEKQVSILKQQMSTAGAVQSNDSGDKEARATARRKAISRITLNRRKGSSEFGEWGDKD